jgi:hypothetical protein
MIDSQGRRWWPEDHLPSLFQEHGDRFKRLLAKAAWHREPKTGVVVCCECGGRDYSHEPGCEVAAVLSADLRTLLRTPTV